ncbi:alpha/beta fold hydrolase [Mycolicibacterium vaccae]|uniref:Hydrolase or acyltransferase of alpha/beta superfamily protein n=1 Tax=Mycolicibacterium vaccae ATCC 25954 TaxID=1194972 RepID=K0UJE2_MYCVA|nr:alpha/beta hydrolase [Mycolicibacterium vaccae]EJZ07317.1 hydrolase or acyltransferase of alpha/beta superfamily protein [Mycolicibacterium vaccae ATCC 25954]MCV7059826.1 alpha/beta fold hydrolase [Mycolicibacterium vaccae]
MGRYAGVFGPHAPESTYVGHAYPEQLFDTGEVRLNYAVAGDASASPLLLIPGQTESWWGYEPAMGLLAEHFHVHAVDLRGQGRSTRTPRRYTLDNIGNDLVRFLDGVIGRPAFVSGLSSGGLLSAWLSAFAEPGQVLAACYEDPPFFSSELDPVIGPGLMSTVGPLFALYVKYLGDQWSIGDWDGFVAGAPQELAGWQAHVALAGGTAEPPQHLKEYDPEWGRAFVGGTFTTGCPHQVMLSQVKVPVLFTHHFRMLDDESGSLIGAATDDQAARVVELVENSGAPLTYRSFPMMGHSMHAQDPALFAGTLVDWFTAARS